MWFIMMIGMIALALAARCLGSIVSICLSLIQLTWIFVSSILRQVLSFILEAFIYQYHDFRYYAAIKKEKLKASQEQIN